MMQIALRPNPTMSGMVRGTAGTGTIRVEFDHNADGVMDGYVKVAPDTTFHYDPLESIRPCGSMLET